MTSKDTFIYTLAEKLKNFSLEDKVKNSNQKKKE